jgi:O-antigen ligase
MDNNAQHEIGFHRSLGELIMAMVLLVPIAIGNKYIFIESNLLLLLLIMILSAFVFRANRIGRRGLSLFLISFFLFIVYAWARLDHVWQLSLSNTFDPNEKSGFSFVFDSIVFGCLFLISALLYYKKNQFPTFLWFLICGYIIAFILRNSFDITGLQEGYNLSPGFVLLTLLPFVYLANSNSLNDRCYIANTIFVISVFWLALIGARTAFFSLLLFFAFMRAWPTITRNRVVYYSTFFGMLLLLVSLTIIYLLFENLDAAVLEGTGFHVFSKRLGTRTEIWTHLLYYISQNPWYGYGTDHATGMLQPLSFLHFSIPRSDLTSHSTYFEILYRLGIVGLLLFLSILFSIWRLFWSGRKQWTVRVAGSFLLSLLFFSCTAEFLVFTTMQLRSGFVWIVLGLGAASSLRAMSKARQRLQHRMQEINGT